MPDQTNRPCWGEIGLPLLPRAWQRGLLNLDLGIPRRRQRRRQTLHAHTLCSNADWSQFKWPDTPAQTAIEVFSWHLDTDPEPDFIDYPLLPGRLRDPHSITTIPFLTGTWDILESAFPTIDDLAEALGTATALELLQLTGCTQTVLDVAITAPSWVMDRTTSRNDDDSDLIGRPASRNDDGSGLLVVRPEQPADIDDAVRLAGLRHLRTACVPQRRLDDTSGWTEALAGRAGISLNGQLTLEEAGRLVGVTRERMRQVAKDYRLEHKVRRRWPLTRRLQSIKDTLERSVGESLDAVEDDLNAPFGVLGNDFGSGTRPLGFKNAVELLDWYGHPVRLELDPVERVRRSGEAFCFPESVTLDSIRMQVWELSEGTGFLREPDLARVVRDLLPDHSGDDLLRIIDAAIGKDRLPFGYLFVTKHAKPTVHSVLRQMLSWASPLSLAEVYEGLDRKFRHRRFPTVPPIEVIRALIDRLDGFEIDDDLVSLTTPETPETETVLGWIGTQLRDAEDHVLHRSTILEACRQTGRNTSSVGVFLQFGVIVAPVGRGCFRLVGSRPTASSIDVARTRGLRENIRTQTDYQYANDGMRLSVTVGNDLRDGGVLSVNARTQRLIANRRLAITSYVGPHGNCALSGSLLYGFPSVLNALGVMPGDQIWVEINFMDNTAHVLMAEDADF